MGKDRYRICRVVKLIGDEDSPIRKVEIQMRPRDRREQSLPYNPKELISQTMSIQRLVRLPVWKEDNNDEGTSP